MRVAGEHFKNLDVSQDLEDNLEAGWKIKVSLPPFTSPDPALI